MYRNNKTSILGIVITVIILIVIVIISNIKFAKISYIENALTSLVMPIQNGLTYIKNKVSGNDAFFTDINNLKEENKQLQDKNSELEQSLRELEIIKAENETLKEQLNLTEKYSEYKTIPAYIINRDISNYSSDLVINRGSKDGIQVNMTVISDKGLVGHVNSVTESTAKIQTIVDLASSVSCTISTSRDSIIVKGSLEGNSTLKATYIPVDADLVKGDSIETSGVGGIYPKGIHVGTISKIIITKNVTDRYAMIETAVDFSKIETVLIVTGQ